MFSRPANFFIIINSLLFVVLIIVLGNNYRLVPEDYFAVRGIEQYGVWQQTVNVCNTWGGRFFSYLLTTWLVDIYLKGFPLFIYYLAAILILFFSFYRIINFSVHLFRANFSKTDKINLSVLTIMMLFYLTIGKEESWFWAMASPGYLGGLVMALLGISMMVGSGNKWIRIFVTMLCFMYSGSASEPFALILVFFFVCAAIFSFRIELLKKNRLMIFIALISIVIGFSIMLSLPGTTNRWNALPQFDFFIIIKRDAGAVVKYFVFDFYKIIPFIILYALPFLLIGSYMKKINNNLTVIKIITIGSFIFALIVSLSFLPSCFVMGEAGPKRSWHHISLYLTILIVITATLIGNKINLIPLFSNKVFYLWLILITMVNLAILINQTRLTSEYAYAVDQRILFLKVLNLTGHKDVAYLNRLPGSGMLFSAEISEDKNYYLNKFLKEGLHLNFDIALKPVSKE